MLLLTLVLSCSQFAINYPSQGHHNNLFKRYGHDILSPLPNNSVLLLNGDLPQYPFVKKKKNNKAFSFTQEIYITEYYYYCERVRPDIALVNLELASRGYTKYPLSPAFLKNPL